MCSVIVPDCAADRRELLKKFQLNGMNVRQDALEVFDNELRHGQPPYESLDEFLSFLIQTMLVQMDSIGDYIIDLDTAQRAVDLLRDSRRKILKPFNRERQEVIIKNVNLDQSSSTLSTEMTNFRFQYNQLVKSLKRLPAFQSGKFQLMTIDEMNAYGSNIELKCVVFAMIRQDPSKIMQYLLEDPTGQIPIQFRDTTTWREWATFQYGIYLLEGVYHGTRDSFVVTSIGLPPPVYSILPEPDPTQLEDDDQADPMIILLSDVHLDDRQTIEALKFLFNGYDSLSDVPDLFILVGDFTSKLCTDEFEFKNYMKTLIKLIGTFRKLSQHSRFIFIPGPNDPTTFPELFVKNQFTTDHFPTTTNRIKKFNLATNPFHVQIAGRNLCLFGNRLMDKYLKHIINSKEQLNSTRLNKNDHQLMENFFKSMARLIVTDAHLTSGLNRNYISCLSLFPQIPDLLVLADPQLRQFHQCQPFGGEDGKFNPGFPTRLATLTSFSTNSFQFLVYYCRTNNVEESQISI